MIGTEVTAPTPRRGFLGRLAAASLALGLGGSLARPSVAAATPRRRGSESDLENWPGDLHGKHRQIYDGVSVNHGMSLAWAAVFLDTNGQASHLTDADLNAVVVFRHEAIPLAFTDAIWSKYKLGEAFSVTDPATKAPATRNVFYNARPAELLLPDMAIEKLLARGVLFGVCNIALTILSGQRGKAVGVDADTAKKEWLAGVIPGITVVPAGVWAVNRAQEHGCTYCYAG